MNENINFAKEFRQMRSRILLRAVLSFTIAVLTGLLWTFIYSFFVSESGYVFLVGWAVIAAIWYFAYIIRLEKEMACPACHKSLTDIEGWNVFISSCPHCKVSYK